MSTTRQRERQRRGRASWRSPRTGFTLIELLVVIGIFVLLAAIVLPMGKRIRETNRANTCEAHLLWIGRALRMYFLDEGGVPPVGLPGTMNGSGEPQPSDPTIDLAMWPSLHALFVLGYINDRNILHCPRHMKQEDGTPLTSDSREYYASYTCRDPKAKPTDKPWLQYKYLPYRYRWAGQPLYAEAGKRQLTTEIAEVDIGGQTYLVTGATRTRPDDDTIVTWCNYHADYYTKGGKGQYIVLYWDGSVRLRDAELFQDELLPPPEAWLVKPTD